MLNNNLKNRLKLSSESGAGFTIIELIAVISIISVLLAVSIVNFPQFKSQLSLSRAAYSFAQNTRRAQGLALTSLQYKDASGTVQAVQGYGVYADPGSNNKQYIIYADKDPGNQSYDSGEDYIIETIDLGATEPGMIMQQITHISGTGASINFAPPNPTTTINLASGQNSIDVVFAMEGDQTKTKTVTINTSGLIEVK
jgi:prepilin-type N-terminal cleavage/methylation domain-containing protein